MCLNGFVRKLLVGFEIVIERSGFCSDRRSSYVVMSCDRCGEYKETNKMLKRDHTESRKYGCPFRLCGYYTTATI